MPRVVCCRGDGVQVDGALARGRDRQGGLVEERDAVGVGLAGYHRRVDGPVLQESHVDHGRDRRREVRLDGPEEGVLAGGEVVLVGDIKLGPADRGDGVWDADQWVDDGADVCCCQGVEVQVELFDPGALATVVGHEDRGTRLVVLESYRAELRVHAVDLDTDETALIRQRRVSVVPGVELSVGVGLGVVDEVTLGLVSLAFVGR